jgi:DNA-binding transcriptional MerR regulator
LFGYIASMLDARQIAEIVRAQDRDLEVTSSTLHYYVQVGILPPAVGRGRSGYTPEHLSRFRLARRLKRQGLGLAEVRDRLSRLSLQEVAAELGPPQLPGLVARGFYAAPAGGPLTLREPGAGEPAGAPTSYSVAAEALRARRDTPRTLRFRGGFSLQVPSGTTDEQIARLYAAIEAALNEEETP